MITLATEEKCTGCMSCVQSCPKQAIGIYTDVQGNCYPKIDLDACVSCHKCERVCPVLATGETELEYPKKAYAVWSLDDTCRKASASGGAAAELYRTALEQNWWICGAAYADEFHVKHVLTKNPDMIAAFQQSKYVYSEIDTVYAEIKEKLEQKENVLFISLPCKIAGLKKYLGKQYEGLVTVDIVCHGTPPYKILHDHILEVQNKRTAAKLSFREDNRFIFELKSQDQVVYKRIGRTDTYLAAFLEGLNYRKSCYHCLLARPERIGDLTICDFWGLGTKIPFDHPYTGAISAVLLNTEKGKAFFEKSRGRFFAEERPVEEAIEGNHQLREPTKRHPQTERYESLYKSVGFEQAVKTCLAQEMKAEKAKISRQCIRACLRKIASAFIKKYRS